MGNILKNYINDNSFRIINSFDFEQALLFFNAIHFNNKKSFISFGYKDLDKKNYNQLSFGFEKSQEVIEKLIGRDNIYISINSFCKLNRKKDSLRQLNALWVDIDYYKIPKYKDLEPSELISIMEKKGLFKKLKPSFFVYSGNGLYLYFLIEDSHPNCLPLWSKLQKKVNELYTEFGADPRAIDCCHVFRLPGTVNTKTGKRVELIRDFKNPFSRNESFKRYSLKEIANMIAPELVAIDNIQRVSYPKALKKEVKSFKDNNSNLQYKSFNTLYFNRLKDLEALQRHRLNCEGNRELMCLLYRLFSLHISSDFKYALDCTLKFNSRFDRPLSSSEVISSTKSAELSFINYQNSMNDYSKLSDKTLPLNDFLRERGCYIYGNSKLIELLDITKEEMKFLSTIIDEEEKTLRKKDYNKNYYEENKEYLKEKRKENYRKKTKLKEEVITDTLFNIKLFLEQGLSQSQISKILNISKATFYRYKKKMNELQII